ncbi:MAG: hypothetical protein KGL39_40385 [Patescibacteria group bacterium]|nr:hypothetical protein [Patescibacteria group bacterium]
MIDRKLRMGDVISVRAVVKHNQDLADGYVHIRVGGEYKPTVTVDVENIVAFIQPKVDVEDVVRFLGEHEFSGMRGTVRAVWDAGSETLLWVETAGAMATWRAADVEVEPEVEPATPPPPAKND